MYAKRATLAAVAAAVLFGGAMAPWASMVSELPEESAPEAVAAPDAGGHEFNAIGGYHFTIPADFFGTTTPILNRLTFNARRDADGSVSGWFTYEQEGEGQVSRLGGPVTCFRVHDTPVLDRFPEIPAQAQNRAKWGGRIEITNDPSLDGLFIWFNSIDNGEGANGWADISSIPGLGPEAANEAFCNSPSPPNPRFGPFAIGGGNIQVR